MFKHYVVVRRDVPFGVILANVGHAAGESFFLFCPRSSDGEQPTLSRQDGPSQGSGGSIFRAENTVMVVLRAQHDLELERLRAKLHGQGVLHVAIRETDGPYAGQLMAVGVVPTDRDIRKVFNGHPMFTEAS